ncbi:MAG: DNA polymerase III subunit alpha [Thermoguttaceae bacterium]
MSTQPFAHLHCHSHYSLLDGAGTVRGLLDRAKALGMTALALTDHGNLHGALKFYQAAKDLEINPVIGLEAYIAPGSRFSKEASGSKEAAYHLTLLAQNATGFRNLVKLSSAAFLEGFYFKPRIDKQLLSENREGLICLSGCVASEFNRTILAGGEANFEKAVEIATWFRNLFGDDYYIEIQNNHLEIQQAAMKGAVEIARRLDIPLVATSDVHYVLQEDSDAQDILLCVNTGKFRTDTNRMRMETNEFHLRSPEEMYAAFPGLEDAVARSQEIADGVKIELEIGKRHFPVYSPPDGKTAEDFLYELCVAGLKDRYANRPDRYADGKFSDEVTARLERELKVINKLGFANYFLIVWDYVQFARSQGIEATARGSGVGALVSYGLYLSHVCPLEYDLLFERFLDESRREAPDIDIDFCQQRRGEVIQYVKGKYGADNVAQIGTFGTLAARAAIRDVGRALGLPIPRVDSIVALVPDELKIKLKDAIQKSDELKKMYEGDPEVRKLLDLAKGIEGLARNVGTHAAAVVIADRPLTDYLPLQHVQDKKEVITQWDMGDVERAGLLKMDFLGLRNLTILTKVIDLIEQTTGERINPYGFRRDDKETFALLCRGETKGVFQLESGGIRDLLQRMKPDHFLDIIATNALYRPGPLEGGMVDDYIEVKHGRKKPEYKHPVMEEVLGETHGVMVYQEQVMRILNRLGGIKLANAYSCIKAISKKKLEMIAKYREEFIEGAHQQGMDKKEAAELFGLIEKFAGYGFNKCVVGATAIVDAQTGQRTTVEELFHNRRPFTVHSLAEDGRLRPQSVSEVVWNGRKRVYELTTSLGKRITATANHPFRTLDGWKLLEELRPGDRIAGPRRLDVAGQSRAPRHEIIALAYLLAEGNTCHPTCLYFYNNDPKLVDEFAAVAKEFPETVARIDRRDDGRRLEVCVSTGINRQFAPGQRPWNARQSQEGGVGIAAPPARSGMFRWAQSLDIVGRRATQKAAPPIVFQWSDADLELFLGRLWAGDGYLGARSQMPFYATSARQLAIDVQTLLLRLGIVARVRSTTFKYTYKGQSKNRQGYTVHLVGSESLKAFLGRVAPHAIGREKQTETLRHCLSEVTPNLTSKDTIPAEIRQWVDAQRRQAGLTWRGLQSKSGVCVKEFVGAGSAKKRGFRRATIGRLADFFRCRRLLEASQSDIFWETVVSVEPKGVQDTYDLTVENDHNFVADGLVVHNSHSTAYALIAYMTAYLKAHYKVEFMAALLSSDIPGRNFKRKDSLVEHLEDCQRMSVTVLPPDVNRSGVEFTVLCGAGCQPAATEKQICYGLSAIKGCGGAAANAIAVERAANGPYHGLSDFCERLDPSTVNRTAVESLIKAGALDSLGARRSQLFAGLDRALQAAVAAASDRRRGQRSLFGGDGDQQQQAVAAGNLPDLAEWEEHEKLAKEKEVLGFYLSSHPLAEHETTLSTYCSHNTVEAAELKHRTEVMLGGMLAAIKFSHTKNPKPGAPSRYAMFDLEDTAGMMRCIVWPDLFARCEELIKPDAIVAIRGAIDKRPGSEEANLIVNEVIPLEELASRCTRGVRIRVIEEEETPRTLDALHEILRGYPGQCELQLVLCLRDGSRVECRCDGLHVAVAPQMRSRVDQLLGPGNVRLLTAPLSSGRGERSGR